MSILIKGMDMPKNEPLLIKLNPDGSVSTTAKNGYRKYATVPVPPHGRLADMDVLFTKAYEAYGLDADETETNFFMKLINDAPTVIPKEEECE